MKLSLLIDEFISDREAQGRINSEHTKIAYRAKLYILVDEVRNRPPDKIGRGDIKRVLRHWSHPNSYQQAHAILRSFFDWAMEEGYCTANPARLVAGARAREPQVYRMTSPEIVRFWNATEGQRRDRWVAALGLGFGLRSQEIRWLRGMHLAREGWLWISSDIGKGHKERWVPVLSEFAPTVNEMVALVQQDSLVLPGRRWIDPRFSDEQRDVEASMAASSLYRQVKKIAVRAGLPPYITPHSLRHAYGDHVAKQSGLRVAQALMGHARVETTADIYTSNVGLDELAANVAEFRYGLEPSRVDAKPRGGYRP